MFSIMITITIAAGNGDYDYYYLRPCNQFQSISITWDHVIDYNQLRVPNTIIPTLQLLCAILLRLMALETKKRLWHLLVIY